MMGHPEKKLLFMGQDFGQLHEWDEKVSLDWYLTEEELHSDLQHYVRDLLHIYQKYPALYESDDDWDGFQCQCQRRDRTIFALSALRKKQAEKPALCLQLYAHGET